MQVIDYRQYHLNHKPTPHTHELVRRARHVGHRSMMAGAANLPPEINALMALFPGPVDQGIMGSCTGHAVMGFRETLHGSATGQVLPYRLSRYFPYYNARKAEGTFPTDSGATMGDEFACLEAYGICKETDCPYDPNNPGLVPSAPAFVMAAQFKVPEPAMVHTTQDGVMSIIAQGLPVAGTFPVYDSFYQTGADGAVPMPSGNLVGGHGIFILAYDQIGAWFANSWGTGWGKGGFGRFPWAYLPMFYELWTSPKVS